MIMVLGLIAGNSVRGVEEESIKDYQKSVPIEYPEDMEQGNHILMMVQMLKNIYQRKSNNISAKNLVC